MADLTPTEVEELEALLGTVRRRTPLFILGAVLLLATLALASFGFLQARQSAATVQALAAEEAAQQRANQLQQQEGQAFLRDFTAEENYVCRLAAAYAAMNHLEVSTPGVCAVTLPSPTAAPTASGPPRPPRVTSVPRPAARPVAKPSASASATAAVTATATPAPVAGGEKPPKKPCDLLTALLSDVLSLLTVSRCG